jgi:hypothetical protein
MSFGSNYKAEHHQGEFHGNEDLLEVRKSKVNTSTTKVYGAVLPFIGPHVVSQVHKEMEEYRQGRAGVQPDANDAEIAQIIDMPVPEQPTASQAIHEWARPDDVDSARNYLESIRHDAAA